MIKITVGGKTYKGVYRWSDITIKQYSELAAIPIPTGYEAFILLQDSGFDHSRQDEINQFIDSVAKITDEDLNYHFPYYYREVIKCLSTIPENVLYELEKEEIEKAYNGYFKPFVLSLIYHVPVILFMGNITNYTPEEIKSFRIGLNKYYLPAVVRIGNQDIPLANEPVVSFIEASDVFKGQKITKDDIDRMAFFMALYCRKRGEKYDEAKVLERQSLFMKAPVSVFWSVFFYTVRRISESEKTIQLFGGLPKQIPELVRLARDYKSMVTEPLLTSVQGTEVTAE